MKIVDTATMARVDRLAQEQFHIPGEVLMENAGIKCYQALRGYYPMEGLTAFVAGAGNNGGDALVMARQTYLDGGNACVVLAGPLKSKSAKMNLSIIEGFPIPVVLRSEDRAAAMELISSANLVVDGLFGTGLSGPLRDHAASFVAEINECGTEVASIDVPSGVGDDYRSGYPAINAGVTLCLGLLKRCLYLPAARPLCGEIIHVPIGFPPALLEAAESKSTLLTPRDIVGMVPHIPRESHKSTRGRVAVFAGSRGTTGAAVLAAESAARSRSGLVFLQADEEVYEPIASQLVSVMAKPWKAEADPGAFDIASYNAFVAGPGWGFEGRAPWLDMLIQSGVPGVIDADGLTLLAGREKPDMGGRIVLTPHPGEMARLSGVDVDSVIEDPYEIAVETSRAYHAVVVLKGHVTVIADPSGTCAVIDGMNPALGTGGSGDVLSGIIGGILAGGVDAGQAAKLGVLIHSKVASDVREERGWFLAEDLLPGISKAFGGSS